MKANLYRVALVGAASLKGRELNEVLSERNFPAADIRLLDDDESLGQLEAAGEEASFIQAVRAEQFEHMDFTFFSSDEDFTRRYWKMARNAGSSIIDLSYALENEPQVAIRAPWIERELGSERRADLESNAAVTTHPAAVVLALVLLRLQKAAPLTRTIATIFEPVSERGKRGMDELHEQTVNLLSFQQMPKAVFDVQVAFNLLSHYGERAGTTLQSVERRVVHHLREITSGRVPVPSLMLVQSPIFHGHIFSIYIELGRELPVADVAAALAGEHVTVIASSEEQPNNVNVAGQENVLVAVRPDHQKGIWIWAAADNLKLSAITAVDCAAALALTRSQGTVQ
jgi:aspartate-semialdehyde dehydrogenase